MIILGCNGATRTFVHSQHLHTNTLNECYTPTHTNTHNIQVSDASVLGLLVCTEEGGGVGRALLLFVCVCVCVCISGSDRHTFTSSTPIASLLPHPHFPTTVPAVVWLLCTQWSPAAIWSMDLQLFTFPLFPL